MQTPWGTLKNLDLTDHCLCEQILSSDKHQLVEGLVVENIFDQIVAAVPELRPDVLLLDVETVIAGSGGPSAAWYAFVWARSRQAGLGRYLKALEGRFHTYMLEFDKGEGLFIARACRGGQASVARIPLGELMSQLSGRAPARVSVAPAVRDSTRQKLGFWGYLADTYRETLGERVILPRLLLNFGIQPWFPAVWNLDRILVAGDCTWALEIKHKFPFGKSGLRFGIIDGELRVIDRLGETGIRCLHVVLAKPTWTKDSGSAYLLGRLAERERAALIGVELDRRRVARMLGSAQGTSAAHTTFTGRGTIPYRSLPAREFSRIGMMTDPRVDLARGLLRRLDGEALDSVSDDWLRSLRTPSAADESGQSR